MLLGDYPEVEKLDEAINAVLVDLIATDDYDEFAKLVDQLTKLTKIKQIIAESILKVFEAENKDRLDTKTLELKVGELFDKKVEAEQTYTLKKAELDLKKQESEKPDRVSKETLALIAGNIAGIVLIIGYERVNVIASKALNFVLKR